MVKLYMDQQRQEMEEKAKKKLEAMQENQTPVLMAKKDIPPNSIIEPDSLEVSIIPNQYVAPQAVTSLDRIAGMMTIASISKGEQITLSKLVFPKEVGGLAGVTPGGKRAITISVDNVASLAGMVKGGDYVDVIVMVPVPVQGLDGKQTTQVAVIPLFQNVLVLAVGQETAAAYRGEKGRYQKDEQREASPLITLALTPQEANLIAFVQEQGKIRLILRSPVDTKIEPVQAASWETFFQYVFPQPPKAQTQEEAPASVEIYRGLNKEKVPLNK